MPTIWVNISFILFQMLMIKTIYAKSGSTNIRNTYGRLIPPRYNEDDTSQLPEYEEPPSYEEIAPPQN
jgi:hypothetical protein